MAGEAPTDERREAEHEVTELALRFTSSIAPLVVGRSEVPDDLDAMYRLRGAEAVERGWAAAGSLTDVRDCDEYDADAVHIAIRDGAEVIGTCRVILPSPERLLPVERDFDLRLQPACGVVQWSRLVLHRRCRGDPRHRLALACLAALWLETTRHGFDTCAGAIAQPILDMYRGIGVEVQVLGAARFIEGEQRYPATTTAATIRTALARLRTLL
jgi:N-acyl-L-homoserine lactone synthetase